MFVSAILLAAGESRRMGSLKQLLPFGERTVIETCIANLLASTVNEIIVVLGHKAEEIAPTIEKYPVKTTINPEYADGMASSIKAGINVVNNSTTAFLFALVDQPLIDPTIIDSIIDGYQANLRSGKKIVIPQYQGKGGHPTIFDAALRDQIQNIDFKVGLKQVKDQHLNQVLYLAVDDPRVVEDMDYWQDYQRQLSLLK